MGLYLGGLIIGRIFASEIWGAYFWEGLLWGGGGGYFIMKIDEKSFSWTKKGIPFVFVIETPRVQFWRTKNYRDIETRLLTQSERV